MANALTLSFPQTDVALITFDLPGKGANILSLSVLQELSALLDQLQKRGDLAGLVIKSGKPGTFIAGADIREFLASLGAPKSEVVATCRRGQQIFQRLSQLPLVTVAAIDGIAAGGGAEQVILQLPADQARLLYPRVTAWTNDRSTIFYSGSTLGGIWSLPLAPGPSGARSAQQLVKDPDTALNIRLAPSQRWFSYQASLDAGPVSQIFVDAYPGGGKRQQVSARGTIALWAQDGKSLYYADDNILTVVSVTEADGALKFGDAPPQVQPQVE
jgi:enoyl-CoA hydratase/carnithine racemase